jgi:hypothetical protein
MIVAMHMIIRSMVGEGEGGGGLKFYYHMYCYCCMIFILHFLLHTA